MPFSKTPRSLFILVVISLLVVLVPRVEAQVDRPARTQTGAVDAAAAGAPVAVNPEVLALNNSSDLIIRDLGFTGRGEITFELKNRGDVPINPKSVSVPEDKQIKVTVYLNDAPFRTVFQPGLAGKQSKIFTLAIPENARPRCAQSRPLKTVIDPANVIVELTDTNNVAALTAARPCPDLGVQSIKRNYNDLKTEYVAKVTLINQGNAPVESFEYLAMTGANSLINALPNLDDKTAGPLAPGETKTFNIGSAFATNTMWVRVWLDRRFVVDELNESNNLVDKKLD